MMKFLSITTIRKWAGGKPTGLDALVLIFLLVIITLQPFYLYGRINLFEAGLYLPGIDAILKGGIPCRDFFHLRGPLELYFQALWMKIIGNEFAVLPTYFYVGAITNLIILLLIAKEIFQTRFFIYIMTFAFIARTFPRVSLTIGGGFRHVWGALAVYCVIRFLKSRNDILLWLTGMFCAIALLTSIEIGIYASVSVIVTLCVERWMSQRKWISVGSLMKVASGASIIFVIIGVYLSMNQALVPMLNDCLTICLNMVKTFPQIDPVPRNAWEVLMAMFNPTHENFKQLTPLFCYVGVVFYIIYLYRRRMSEWGTFCLAIYGFLFFIGSMRALWGPGFENAIQPEKILLFVLLEQCWFYLKNDKHVHRQFIAAVLIIGVLLSTFIYVIPRFQKRFVFMQIMLASSHHKTSLSKIFPFGDKDLVLLDTPRMKGMIVPLIQAQDIQELNRYFATQSAPTDKVVFFPDLGVYNFIVDRPFVGRFPVVELSWMSNKWHDQWIASFKNEQPPFVVTYKVLPDYIPNTQLIVPANKLKYDQVLKIVAQNYQIVYRTPTFNVWRRYF